LKIEKEDIDLFSLKFDVLAKSPYYLLMMPILGLIKCFAKFQKLGLRASNSLEFLTLSIS